MYPSGMRPIMTCARNVVTIESPKRIMNPCVPVILAIVECWKPTIRAITERTKPAIGPEAPISTRAFRVVMGDFILMKAPKVPTGEKRGGAGKK